MKSLKIILLILIAYNASIQAQLKHNLIGIQTGLNSDLNYTHKSINTKHIHGRGWSIGVNYEKFVSKSWSINLELNRTTSKSQVLNYSTVGYNSMVGITSTRKGDVEIDNQYNQLAILVRKYLGKNQLLFFELGWDIKRISKNEGNWNYTSTVFYDQSNVLNPLKLDEPEISIVNSKYTDNSGYIGINLGVGSKFKLSNRFHLLTKGRFSSQLKKTNERGGIIFRNIEFLVGIQYKLSVDSEKMDDSN